MVHDGICDISYSVHKVKKNTDVSQDQCGGFGKSSIAKGT